MSPAEPAEPDSAGAVPPVRFKVVVFNPVVLVVPDTSNFSEGLVNPIPTLSAISDGCNAIPVSVHSASIIIADGVTEDVVVKNKL